MSFREYLAVLRRWAWLILGFAIIAGGAAVGLSLLVPKTYASTTVALVSPKQVLANPHPTYGDQSATVDQLVLTYLGLVDTQPVRQRMVAAGVARRPDQLRGHIVALRVPNTTLINVTVEDSDPAVALEGAQTVIDAVNSALEELQSKAGSSTHLEALIPWEVPTELPQAATSPNIPRNAGTAASAGLLVAILVVIVLERLRKPTD
jgi:capsular polysaccharide biosynthesis protein